MPPRTLLLCFDAFGTIFRPKQPIAAQYNAVARQCGLTGLDDSELHAAFKAAFLHQARTHPNYGKATGMGAHKWWTDVIHGTFQPVVGEARPLPADLAPRLLRRFATAEAYDFALDPRLFRLLKRAAPRLPLDDSVVDDVVVGVITNSDDRVPGILSSLGLAVSPLRAGAASAAYPAAAVPRPPYDIDFHCMSYDVGFEKPDRRIFEAAEAAAAQVLATQQHIPGDWIKVYVGDEYKRDVVGALGAGWNSVLVADQECQCSEDVRTLGEFPSRQVFSPHGTAPPVSVRVPDVDTLLAWLVGPARTWDGS